MDEACVNIAYFLIELCDATVTLGVFPVRYTAAQIPIRVRSGGVVGDRHHCSSHEVDPRREPGSHRETSVGLRIVPLSVLHDLRRPHAPRGWF